MRFIKMYDCENNYIYVDCFREKVTNPEELSIKIFDRHFGAERKFYTRKEYRINEIYKNAWLRQ